jgi:hypothetical protein
MLSKKFLDTNWRYSDRPKPKEVPARIKRGEECHAQTSIGHGVKHSMRGRAQEEIYKHPSPHYRWLPSIPQAYQNNTQQTGKE